MILNNICQHCASSTKDTDVVHVFSYDIIIGEIHYLCETDNPVVFCNMGCFSDFLKDLQQLGGSAHGSQKPS